MSIKFTKKILLALSAAALLASCNDTITASLKNADANAALIQNIGEIPNNKLKVIYDALVTNSTSDAEKVKNNVLYAIAQGEFGTFYDEGNSQGLLSIVKSSDAKILEWGKKKNPYKIDGEDKVVSYVKDFYTHVIDAINDHFWGIVGNESYKERGIFKEKKFYEAEVNELYKLAPVAEDDFVEKAIDGFLTKDDAATYFTDYLVTYKDYIERSILPTIFRKALVEQYIYEKNYSDLGRSYAREVQYIKLADVEGDASATLNLVKSFAKNVLVAGDEAHSDLRYLDLLYKGYFDDIDAEENTWAVKVYEDAGWKGQNGSPDGLGKVAYAESKYGKLVKDYTEVIENGASRWKSSGKDFTGNGKYVKEVGMAIKTRDIIGSNNVTEGWYDSNGLSGVTSEVRTRLFKIQVANEVDSINYDLGDDGKYTPVPNAKGNFGWYVSGSYYMIPAKFPEATEFPYVIHDGSDTYIVKVKEAVKTAKLAKDGNSNYETMAKEGRRAANAPTQHQIVTKVEDLKSGSSANEKAAYKSYIQNAAIAYHDSNIYNYFAAQFPDLF